MTLNVERLFDQLRKDVGGLGGRLSLYRKREKVELRLGNNPDVQGIHKRISKALGKLLEKSDGELDWLTLSLEKIFYDLQDQIDELERLRRMNMADQDNTATKSPDESGEHAALVSLIDPDADPGGPTEHDQGNSPTMVSDPGAANYDDDRSQPATRREGSDPPRRPHRGSQAGRQRRSQQKALIMTPEFQRMIEEVVARSANAAGNGPPPLPAREVNNPPATNAASPVVTNNGPVQPQPATVPIRRPQVSMSVWKLVAGIATLLVLGALAGVSIIMLVDRGSDDSPDPVASANAPAASNSAIGLSPETTYKYRPVTPERIEWVVNTRGGRSLGTPKRYRSLDWPSDGDSDREPVNCQVELPSGKVVSRGWALPKGDDGVQWYNVEDCEVRTPDPLP